jgi:Lipase (class 3)
MPSPDTLYEERIMLSLALAAYRGFHLVSSDPRQLKRELRDGLDSYSLLKQEQIAWVWGPATFRFIGSLFDDASAFLVQRSREPARYALVIRGTNPVALRDWLFFDLLAARQERWAPPGGGDDDARISSSTDLGLRTLLEVRGLLDDDAPIAPGHSGALAAAIRSLLHTSHATLGRAAAPLWDRIQPETRDALAVYRAIRRATAGWPIDRPLDLLGDAALLLLTRALRAEVALTAGESEGELLLDVLRGITKEAQGPVELAVTGHSKGGALATALGLRLVERQDEWDPAARAEVKTYTFAGPTPGNQAFAHRAEETLKRRCTRMTNQRDVVTQAWISTQLREVPDLYAPSCESPAVVRDMAEALADSVHDLEYRHAGEGVPFTGTLSPKAPGFLSQAVFQHLYAYAEEIGLEDLEELGGVLGALLEVFERRAATRPTLVARGAAALGTRGVRFAQQMQQVQQIQQMQQAQQTQQQVPQQQVQQQQQQPVPRFEEDELEQLRQLVQQMPRR